jgi:hypothetical protein
MYTPIQPSRAGWRILNKTTTKKIITCTIIVLLFTVYLQTFTPNVSAKTQTDWIAHPLNRVDSAAISTAPSGFSPSQIKTAYNLPSTGGSGTIAIVNAFDYPTAYNDLVTFSNYYGLSTPNFEKHMMASSIATDSLWALETCIDIQWAHAIAPNAKILLVEAISDEVPDILAAVDYARSRSDVVAISMSWGTAEEPAQTDYNSYFTSTTGAAFFAASGDEGSVVYWPASSSNVIAVGGTTLNLNSNGKVTSEIAWSGSGGGQSAYENAPTYQTTYGISSTNGKRCVPDVSYVANPTTGVSVYMSMSIQGRSGWFKLGGTSIGAPQWAAIHALSLTVSSNNLYQNAKNNYATHFRDITSGTTGAYSTTKGYDLATGLGSPITVNFSPTIAQPDFSITTTSSVLTIAPGSSATTSITITAANGLSDSVSLTASPSDWTTFTPATLTGTGTSTLKINVPVGTQAGTYPIIVTGTSGSLSHQLTITVSIPSAPSAPQNLEATSGDSKVSLSWTAPTSTDSNLAISYNIYRGTASNHETLIASAISTLTYIDATVINGNTYYYYVKAANTIGESEASNEVSAKPVTSNTKALSVSVETNKSSYSKSTTVIVTIKVTDGTNPVKCALVTTIIYGPNNLPVWISIDTTNANGIDQFNYKITALNAKGTYRISTTTFHSGYTMDSEQTTFQVI